jgi:hypothetical protein
MPPRKKILSDEQSLIKKKKQKKIENIKNTEENINQPSSSIKETVTTINNNIYPLNVENKNLVNDNSIVLNNINTKIIIENIERADSLEIQNENNFEILTKTTVAKTTVDETTVNETIIAETTVAETTVAKTTVDETTVNETTVDETIVNETTVAETKVDETTVDETTVAETKVDETTVDETTVNETTVDETIVNETTVAKTTVNETTDDNIDISYETNKTNFEENNMEVVENIIKNDFEEHNIEIIKSIVKIDSEENNMEVVESIFKSDFEENNIEIIESIINIDSEENNMEVVENIVKSDFEEDNMEVTESIVNNELDLNNEMELSNETLSESEMNNPLKDIINKLTDNTNNIINEINRPREKEYTLNENQIINILEGNTKLENKKYTLANLMQIFSNFNEAIILFQIIDGNIKYIEKKGYESRNQSVIDLIIKANNLKTLPDSQFLVFTNDYIDYGKPNNIPYLLTFCKNKNYKTNLFPNFNFNHWNEANIGEYENIYNNFMNNKISWENKKDIIFWSGSNTNIIRKKIYEGTKDNENYLINLNVNNNTKKYTISEHSEYKYLLNMNGYGYAGRLNYLFLTGSCVIILKNEDENKVWEEFYYKYFIPGEDYIEILYNDSEDSQNIIEKINNSIKNNNCLKISENGFKKAEKYLDIENIYKYIYDTITELSYINDNENKIAKSVFYTPNSNIFLKNRIKFYSNSFSFNFKGNILELNIYDIKNNIINIKIFNQNTIILYNDNEIYNKYTPLIVSSIKNINYEVIILNNALNIIIENKYNLIKSSIENIEQSEFIISNIDVKTENGGWWII